MSSLEKFGSRLVASNAIAVEINKQGQVKFEHPDLHNGVEWVDSGYRPSGVVKGDHLDIYYDWTPSRGYYVARLPKDRESVK